VVESSASHLLGRCSTTWATPPALFALVIFLIGFHSMPQPAWTMIFLSMLPHSWNDRHVSPCPSISWDWVS
jgi:hypothetical protein